MSKPQKSKPAKLDKTFVYVSCKAPTGILATNGDDKDAPGYLKVLIKGANEGKFNPRNGMFTSTTVGGFGLTEVPFAFWSEWAEKNKAFVESYKAKKLLAVHDSRDEADAWRIENADSVSGFEPLDPNKMPKGLEAAPIGASVE